VVLVLLSLLELQTVIGNLLPLKENQETIYFKVRSASRIGWTGIGFGSHKDSFHFDQ
jgi:hypothetical protein